MTLELGKITFAHVEGESHITMTLDDKTGEHMATWQLSDWMLRRLALDLSAALVLKRLDESWRTDAVA